MKKTLLAVAVPALLAGASAANAANIYKTDTQSLDIYGRAYMSLDYTNEDSTTMYGRPRLGFKGTTKVTDAMTAFFKSEWEVAGQTGGDRDSDGTFHTRYIYAGLDFGDAGSVTFGQFYPANYSHLLVLTDIFNEYGMEADVGLYGYDRESSQIGYSNTFGGLSVLATYQFQDDNNKATLYDGHQNSAYSLGLTYDFDFGLGLHAVYSHQNLDRGSSTTTHSVDVSGVGIPAGATANYYTTAQSGRGGSKNDWGFGADYTLGNLYLAGFYDQANQGSEDVKAYDFVAAYTLNQYRLYAGYANQKDSTIGSYSVHNFKLGTEYHFTPNVFSYVEWSNEQGHSADAGSRNGVAADHTADNRFSVGMEYDF